MKWQPIETVPVDITVLMAKIHDGEIFWISSGCVESHTSNNWWCDIIDADVSYTANALFNKPTHWKLMPTVDEFK